MGKVNNSDTTTLRGWGKRGTAAHIFNFSTKYRVSGQSHVSRRKEPHSTIQIVSWLQDLSCWDAAMLIQILLMLGLELYAPRSKLVILLTAISAQMYCLQYYYFGSHILTLTF